MSESRPKSPPVFFEGGVGEFGHFRLGSWVPRGPCSRANSGRSRWRAPGRFGRFFFKCGNNDSRFEARLGARRETRVASFPSPFFSLLCSFRDRGIQKGLASSFTRDARSPPPRSRAREHTLCARARARVRRGETRTVPRSSPVCDFTTGRSPTRGRLLLREHLLARAFYQHGKKIPRDFQSEARLFGKPFQDFTTCGPWDSREHRRPSRSWEIRHGMPLREPKSQRNMPFESRSGFPLTLPATTRG